LLKPARDSYHPTKHKGGFTHYGDQAFLLLQSVSERKGFDLNDFSRRWRDFFSDYGGYVDQASRMTLSGYASGKGPKDAGSPSDDLAGASRAAPLVYCYANDCTAAVDASRAQTKMTHNNPVTIDSAEFFIRVAWHVLNGSLPSAAMREIAEKTPGNSPIPGWVRAGMESKGQDSVSVISQFGQSCHTREAFPGVVHLIAKYEEDLKEALIQAVMAGGDSAARGMLVGMVLGAHLGHDNIPKYWLFQLEKREEISALLDKMA
jgi:ADP-ribosylglycohydrolase